MRELLPSLIDRVERGPVALARVVDVTGAGPREIGAAMVVTANGEVLGSISGGCVEGAVAEAAAGVIAGSGAVLERFGVVDPDGIAVGLTCGGEMEVFVERVDRARRADLVALHRGIDAHRPVALVTTLRSAPEWRVVWPADEDDAADVSRDARGMARAGRTGTVGADDGRTAFPPRAFVHSFGPPARLILAGANDFVRALSRIGAHLGYRVTVVDARETFTTPARFPAAHDVVVDWPHRYLRRQQEAGLLDGRTVVIVLTHDPKFDVPMLAEALALDDLAFIGALGSRRTHADRVRRLTETGVPPNRLRRLHSPVGLDLNARTPEETAVSIAAQILAETSGGTARPLARTHGPIHR
ncbi:XdhC family protein [Nocardia terpenica]|uniref:XdhC family protein n=1 Tax=Nocardia terpenica TaxID=455432 RepID=UPI001893A44B|nr:XdhC/CoxI family protein [Nocardia terpenica]MBF6065324.1 XdhC family protein [Nocardia terpenica]MBF6108051.1 XdhC family protein [Nocardia terpenica]MBF6115418.1 XdhC family protein [Nocardia terpenica]MBF6121855.1 XdhC family protein [Nocardia terpenica]MBF6155601.1 XdhC family protein [Nocardia terpenica]